ncbi:Guanine nucleotide-binding protein alpha-2 subunit [Rhizophlyctis rosea]|uniref:Guanine nucleotide-binding protein alpha-2 subunit n=1 Tax=Rhizophlyctis rosea TaxID=64517 RepID=A0AAD5X528_9FUNG|nr:Guanine nucleotide-binding protein alpha-2 subunit [Rhizophlyctis rosea]
MGVCQSTEEQESAQKSQAIDKAIEEDSRAFRRDCKILLLGGGESGKSTIVKQMKIIHQNGYTKEEMLAFRPTIYKNTIDSVQALVMGIRGLGLEWEKPQNKDVAERLMSIGIGYDGTFKLTPEIAHDIKSIFDDGAAKVAIDRSNEFYLLDSASYFFSEITRIGSTDYTPSEQDILRARVKTTGIAETRFTMGQLQIHMFDVGGQRSERRKWIHCFEAVTSIIFCVALSEYDQVLLEESTQNRMAESLTLFESVINSRWFLRTSIILFLNKIDLFKDKLIKNPLENYYPEYKGGPDWNKAAKFILWRFTQKNRARLNIYPQ